MRKHFSVEYNDRISFDTSKQRKIISILKYYNLKLHHNENITSQDKKKTNTNLKTCYVNRYINKPKDSNSQKLSPSNSGLLQHFIINFKKYQQ